jgi:hypothetical protein
MKGNKMEKLIKRIVRVANLLDSISYEKDAEMLTKIAEVLAGKEDYIPTEDDSDNADDDSGD